MNYGKKITAILAAVLTPVFILAGCSQAAKQETTTTPAENTTASNSGVKTNTVLPENDSTVATFINAKAGDVLKFGRYEQDNDTSNGKEVVSWKVLAVENGKALLISVSVLDGKPYNDTKKDVTWETCSLRSWLNSEFINSAFNQDEQKALALSAIENKDNAQYKTDGGNSTQDKVFCLSIDEAKTYFKTDTSRNTGGTQYAEAQGVKIFDFTEDKVKEKDAGWWLRSPGRDAQDAGDVYYNGKIHYDYVDYTGYLGVRPAMWIDLKSDLFKEKTTGTTAPGTTAAAGTTAQAGTTAPK